MKEIRLASNNIFIDTNVLIGAFGGIEKDERCLRYLFSMDGRVSSLRP